MFVNVMKVKYFLSVLKIYLVVRNNELLVQKQENTALFYNEIK